jgi:hypothetical protein
MIVSAGLAGLLAGLLYGPSVHAAASTMVRAVPPTGTAAGDRLRSVTLLTGDRVVLPSTGSGSYGQIVPGPRRASMTYLTHRIDGRLYVVPADALGLVTAGRLDRRLFDVTGLLAAGHDGKGPLPIVVRRASGHPASTRIHRLTSANADSDWWSSIRPLQAGGRAFRGGVTAVLLDRPEAPPVGNGRTDLAAAPARLDFGVQRWPHTDDRPVVRRLSYRNDGKTPIHVTLRAELTGPGGRAVPTRGALTVSSTSLELRPGASRQVTLTTDTRHAGADGRYTGRVVATQGRTRLVTPVTITKEVESYDLTVTHLNTSGRPTDAYGDLLWGLDHDLLDFPTARSATTHLRLPKGDYHLESSVASGPSQDPVFHTVVRPLLTLDHDVSVSVDARSTRPVEVAAPRPSARLALADVGYVRRSPTGRVLQSGSVSRRLDDTFTAHAGPAVGPDALVDRVHTQWAEPDGKGGFSGSPYLYGLFWLQRGRYLTGFSGAARSAELARVTVHQVAQAEGRRAVRTFAPEVGGTGATGGIGGWSVGLPVAVPSTLTAYLMGGDVRWSGSLVHATGTGRDLVDQSWLSSAPRAYQAGRTYDERWNAAVLGPSLPPEPAVVRRKGRLVVDLPMFTDAAGHPGGSLTDTARTTLVRRGVDVGSTREAGHGEFRLRPGPATYRLETSATRHAVADVSTRVSAAWTFRTAPGRGSAAVPLSVIRFAPPVDAHNRVAGTRVSLLPLTVEGGRKEFGSRIRSLAVRVSLDDGRTWRRVRLVRSGSRSWRAVVPTRQDARFVSLQGSLLDGQGYRSEVTVIRAYALR